MRQDIILQVEQYVRQEMEDLCAAHDFEHILRVVENAKKIQKIEGWNLEIVIIGALLHESFDEKFFSKSWMPDKKRGIQNFLKWIWMSESEVEEIIFIMENVWYGKSLERSDDFVWSIEFQIVEDADRLEAIWAIAIARCFTYWGKKWREIYNPNILPLDMNNKEEYYSDHKSTSFNHFYEKLLLLKDLMHTNTGKSLAEPRHEFMKQYMEEFLAEWNGDK